MSKAPVQFSTQKDNPDLLGVYDIDASELANRTHEVHVIDVRQPEEYTGELGHIDGSQLIVLNTLPEKIGQLPKDEPIVFVCKSGGRSAQAAAYAADHGFTQVFNMKGGMLHWKQLGLPTKK